MRKDYLKAVEMRKKGYSYSLITKKLGVPKGTLSGWFKAVPWSLEIRSKLAQEQSLRSPIKLEKMIRAIQTKWEAWREEARLEAIKVFPKFKNNPLFIAGLMLYWGEGDKKVENGVVRLGNSDPELIKIFSIFLHRILGIPKSKIFLSLLLYPDLVDSVQKNFWSRTTGINLSQFKKSVVIEGRHPTKRLSYGVCTIIVHSRQLKEKMMKWLELYKIEFQRTIV